MFFILIVTKFKIKTTIFGNQDMTLNTNRCFPALFVFGFEFMRVSILIFKYPNGVREVRHASVRNYQ